MKIKIALLCLGLANAGFALDEYMPIGAGKLEIDAAYGPFFFNGIYDDDGEKQSIPTDPVIQGFGVQLKYGIMPGLDVEASWVYGLGNEDAGDIKGFIQPDIGLKYAIGETGFAVFGNLTLPFATGDFDTDPSTVCLGIEPGFVYGKNYGKIQAVAKASYLYNLENGDEFKEGDMLSLYLKPGFMINEKVAVYLGADYSRFMESEGAGTGLGDSGYLLAAIPGFTYMHSSALSFEANGQFTLAGKDILAGWGINALAYYTLDL